MFTLIFYDSCLLHAKPRSIFQNFNYSIRSKTTSKKKNYLGNIQLPRRVQLLIFQSITTHNLVSHEKKEKNFSKLK